LTHTFAEGRGGYLYLTDGEATLGDTPLLKGDAVKFGGAEECLLASSGRAEVSLIDVPLWCRGAPYLVPCEA
jgi:hypothetical protein